MTVYKWDFVLREYDEIQKDVSESPTICFDMEKIVRCINCGREVAYGNCFTSLRWHTEHGFGYPVCEECHRVEWEEENSINDY